MEIIRTDIFTGYKHKHSTCTGRKIYELIKTLIEIYICTS